MSGSIRTTKVFLSFAAEDSAFKRNFTHPEWFGNFLPGVELIDYKMGENLPFGSLNDWITEEVKGAAVFVAFVSKNYIGKNYPSREWWSALSEVARRELIFVPVMLDGSAKNWWKNQKQHRGFQDLGDDYAYSDFTDGSGRPSEIITDVGPVDKVIRRIGELARLIREHLEQRATNTVPPEPKDTDEAAPDVGSEDRLRVIVLGHPSALSSPTIQAETDALIAALMRNDISHERWNDQWRINPLARARFTKPCHAKRVLFVQPADSGDAGDLAESPSKLRKWLERICEQQTLSDKSTWVGRTPVVWLPDGLHDDIFTSTACKNQTNDDLVLRADTASTLAEWIRRETGSCSPATISVLTLEEVDVNDAGKLRHALHSSFHALVGEVVQPKPELWTFDGEMLAEQISKLETDRAIVAVHDLNTGTARGQREARMQLERKLGAINCEVQRAVLASGRKNLKLFWSALLVQKADQLPWVKYPAPSQFENWCLLPYITTGSDNGTSPMVKPKQGAMNVFRNYLRDWISEPQVNG